MLAGVDPTAAAIAHRLRSAVSSGTAAGQRSVDAYNYFPLLNNLVFARQAFLDSDATPGTDPVPREGVTHFPDAGIVRVDRAGAVVMVGTSKGGVVKLFERNAGRLTTSDCGLGAQLDHGRPCATQSLDRGQHAFDIALSTNHGKFDGRLITSDQPNRNPFAQKAGRNAKDRAISSDFSLITIDQPNRFDLTARERHGLGKRQRRFLIQRIETQAESAQAVDLHITTASPHLTDGPNEPAPHARTDFVPEILNPSGKNT